MFFCATTFPSHTVISPGGYPCRINSTTVLDPVAPAPIITIGLALEGLKYPTVLEVSILIVEFPESTVDFGFSV